MTLPVVNFENYRGRILPQFNLNARLLTWGANFLFSRRLKAGTAADLLKSTVTGLDQIKFSKGTYAACSKAFLLYDGAKTSSLKMQLQPDQAQKYCDLMAYYILVTLSEDLSRPVHQLSQETVDDCEDILKQILADYARGSHYDEVLRGEIFSSTYQTLRVMNEKFGITLGRNQKSSQPDVIPT